MTASWSLRYSGVDMAFTEQEAPRADPGVGRQFSGIDVIDTHQAFLADGRPLNVVVDPADGVQTTGTGYQFWPAALQVEPDAAFLRVAATPIQ